jgi:hypothetical protein
LNVIEGAVPFVSVSLFLYFNESYLNVNGSPKAARSGGTVIGAAAKLEAPEVAAAFIFIDYVSTHPLVVA